MAAGDQRRKDAVVLSRVRRVQRWLDLEVALNALVVPAWCAVTAAAAWRFVVQRHVFTFGAVAVALALGVWLVLARRKSVRLEDAAIIADRRADAGGLLLTRLEVPVGEWELALNQRVRAVTVPPIDARRPLSWVVLAVLAGVIAFWLPLPVKQVRPTSSAAATRVDALQEKIEALAREEPDDAAAQKELERLREELDDGTFDAADWEAADTLDSALDKQAAQAQAELSKADAAAKALEDAMAAAQSGEGSAREREELEKALMDLADGQAQSADEAMKQAMGEGKEDGKPQEAKGSDQKPGQQGQDGKEGQPGQQGQEGKTQAKSGPSKSQLSSLRQALQQRQQQLSQQFSQNGGQSGHGQQQQASNSGNPGQSGEGQGQKKGAGKGSEQSQQASSANHLSHLASGDMNGSPTHGWEPPKELQFGPEASMDPDRLAFEPLPAGQGGEGEEVLALRSANPQPGKHGKTTAGNAQPATGVQARGNDDGALLPRNRELIKRYFEK